MSKIIGKNDYKRKKVQIIHIFVFCISRRDGFCAVTQAGQSVAGGRLPEEDLFFSKNPSIYIIRHMILKLIR